ncbi:amidohydrolase [soil metagenome]
MTRFIDALLADGRRVDLDVVDGVVVSIDAAAASTAAGDRADTIDLHGRLLLPSLCDGHLHLDKTLMGLPWLPHAAEPFRMSRIETDKKILPHLALSTEQRAINLVRRCVSFGTGYLRTHVDIDLESGLAKLEGVLAARDRCRDIARIEIVAFPQSGVMRRPGTLALMEQAIVLGADLVGGLDPSEIDRDPRGQLDGIFDIANRHGRGVDIHLHEPGELGLFSVQEICDRSLALGMQGKVTISHCFCLGDIRESKLRTTLESMSRAGVMVVTHGAANSGFPPVALLHEYGVNVFAGNDDIRDTWSPYGTGDMLERVAYIGWRADLRRDEAVEFAYALGSWHGATAMGIADYGIAVGHPANFFTIEAGSIAEAVAGHVRREQVVWNGRLVAEQGQMVA